MKLRGGISIRLLELQDLDQVFSMGNENHEFSGCLKSWNAENIANVISQAGSICCTAVRKKRILGYLISSTENHSSRIEWIYVDKKFRKAGIGTTMFEFFYVMAKKAGIVDFFITVNGNNLETINFLNKKGYNQNNTLIEFSRKKE